MATDVVIIHCTFPNKEIAAHIGKILVDERLIACISMLGEVRSIYRWQGDICDDLEVMAIVKTTQSRLADAQRRLIELHPYDCPEVLAVAVAQGHAPYLAWVADNTREP